MLRTSIRVEAWILVHPETRLRGDLDAFLASPYDRKGVARWLARDGRSRGGGRGYSMNMHLDGLRLSELDKPARTILLFEVDPGSPLAGGPMMLPGEPRYRDGYVIVFVNGTSSNVPPDQVHESLVWVP